MSEGFRFRSHSPEQTRDLARALARAIDERGVVVALEGPLGAGKTVFVKGLAAGLEIDPSSVSSPTFVIASEYEGRAPDGSRRLLVHADLYRVGSAAELEGAGYLDWIAPGHVVAMEWAERLRESLPQNRLWVTLLAGDTPEGREIVVTAQGAAAEQALRRWQEAAAGSGEGAGEWA
ncbi:MAG TPA: tRNA (adenosine(37)-N6)-threonylcarbamoyltransferase complex ATPase subunit type 1 TsaE [Myxococcota bacterium]|nr:tRNA (adenosine(37)-N6)-threonylcarbamoyltransferase complex ATPase subunit type 1 TsaE [Myxococcota bacterium]